MPTSKNLLKHSHPEIAAEIVDQSLLDTLGARTNRRVEWRCRAQGHIWTASVAPRTSDRAVGCPYCSGRIPVPGVNDLATTHPEITAELVDPEQATTVGAGSSKKLTWRCITNPEHPHWDAQVRYRTRDHNPTGCPVCAGHTKRLAPNPTLAEVKSPLIAEAVDPDTAANLTTGSGQKIEWNCTTCSTPHTYHSSIRHRMRGQGCPVAAGRTVIPGINDLATTHPEIAAQLTDPELATTISRGHDKLVSWTCDQGHTWETQAYARIGGNGCPTCSPIGSSAGEATLAAAIATLTSDVRTRATITAVPPNTRPVEVDVLTPEVGIEFNGLYWHSEAASPDTNRHLRKVQAIRASGRTAFLVWEDQWIDLDTRALVIRALAHRLNATQHMAAAFNAAEIGHLFDPKFTTRHHARALTATEVPGSQAHTFLRQHHIQGPVTTNRNFALVDGTGQIIALLGLRHITGGRTKRTPGQWDIQRYATSGIVPGGFSKLLAHAERTIRAEGLPLTKWITLSSNDISTGKMYANTGFIHDGDIPPSYWYTNGVHARNQRRPKENFQLSAFRNRDDLKYTEGWTERDAAAANGLLRVYDSGKTRWIKPVT